MDPTHISRRGFVKGASATAGGLTLGALPWPLFGRPINESSRLSEADLPKGKAPLPVPLPHFPDRLHAFVWRNWPMVPIERMAKVVGARRVDIVRMGRAMGLGAPPRISRDQRARSYLTVIRRNWHLLPYEQLLELLGWTAEKLAYTLREDDFLFVKLGSLKPNCEPLRYRAPDQGVLQQEREIAQILREEFPEGVDATSEPLFGFIQRLSRKVAAPVQPTPFGQLKFCYSYFALYGDPLLEQEAEPYPEGYLARLAQAGVTGVWLQAVLYKLARFPWDPERSAQFQTRLKNLRSLVARAQKHGIRVFLYLNEPRAMPLRFFEARPHFKGVVEGDHATMCTSLPEVQRYLSDSVAGICRAVPGLGGFFTITASENLTNCWSHNQGAKCPRCGSRAPAEVIAEVNRFVWEGVQQSGASAQLLAWDWGWDDSWAAEVIRRLPDGVALMSVSEWRLPLERGGIKTEVGEYSISAVGPGPRAKRHWQLARERGLKIVAKIQAGNTWELSAVPYIPALENVARHAENLRAVGVDGLMLGWTLGGYPSPNLEVVSETLAGASAATALQRVAERRFGSPLAPAVVAAWRAFSAAFSEFPFHVGVLYSGPQQLGPANLLWSEPTRYHATMVGFPYDDLDAWRAVYQPETFIQQFERVADGFDAALDSLRRSAAATAGPIAPAHRAAFDDECRVAEAAAIHFRSVANQSRFLLARRAVTAAQSANEAAPHIATLEKLIKAQLSLARRLYRIQARDSRIGFEASNQYYYVPIDLLEKMLNCRDLLARWLSQLRVSFHR